jgi:phage terminase Nu1 subunit (DNA packaging protein)
MIVNRNELADALGITPSKVSAFANQGIFVAAARGKYNLPECVQKFIEMSVEHLLKKSQSSTASGKTEESLQYWKMVRAKNAALKEMGVTMQVEHAEKLMSARLGQIRNVLNSIDSVWAPYMVGLKNVEDSQKMLGKQLDTLFEQLSSLQDFEQDEELPTSEEIEDDGDIDEGDTSTV